MTVPHWFYRIVQVGDTGQDVRAIRTTLNLASEGPYDESVAVRVRGAQLRAGLPVDGSVGLQTAEILGEPASYGQVPLWWGGRELHFGLTGKDVWHLANRLGIWAQEDFDMDVEKAVRRWESARGHYPTGVFTEQYAIEMGD